MARGFDGLVPFDDSFLLSIDAHAVQHDVRGDEEHSLEYYKSAQRGEGYYKSGRREITRASHTTAVRTRVFLLRKDRYKPRRQYPRSIIERKD